jgi:hypothetical protein
MLPMLALTQLGWYNIIPGVEKPYEVLLAGFKPAIQLIGLPLTESR